jgi:hypothetical protein
LYSLERDRVDSGIKDSDDVFNIITDHQLIRVQTLNQLRDRRAEQFYIIVSIAA